MVTSSPLICMLLGLIVAVFIGHVIYEKRRKTWLMIDPFNAFYTGCLIIYVSESITYFEPMKNEYGEIVFARTLMWILFAMLWVTAGYHAALGKKMGRKLPSMPAILKPGALTFAGCFMVGMGIIGYLVIFSTAGGVSNWLAEGRGGTRLELTSGYFTVLEFFLPAGITILLFRVELIECQIYHRALVWVLAGVQWLWLVYLGSRSRTIMFLAAIGAVYYLARRRNPSLMTAAMVGVFLVALATFQLFYRGTFTNLSFHLDTLRWDEVKQKILPTALGGTIGEDTGKGMGDLEINCVAAVVETVPSQLPYNHGYTLLEIFTHGVPRAFWPNKVYPLYEAQTPVMQLRDLSRQWIETPSSRFLQGPSFTFVGYWYHAWGPWALVIAGFLTGVELRMLRTFYDRDPLNQGNLVMYVLMLPIGFSEAVTTPLYWVFYLPLLLIPTMILLYIARRPAAEQLQLAAA